MSPRRGLGLNQFSRSVRQEALQDDARARLCTIRQDLKALALYLYQADLHAHHHLPDDWYAGAQAMLDELKETIRRQCEVDHYPCSHCGYQGGMVPPWDIDNQADSRP